MVIPPGDLGYQWSDHSACLRSSAAVTGAESCCRFQDMVKLRSPLHSLFAPEQPSCIPCRSFVLIRIQFSRSGSLVPVRRITSDSLCYSCVYPLCPFLFSVRRMISQLESALTMARVFRLAFHAPEFQRTRDSRGCSRCVCEFMLQITCLMFAQGCRVRGVQSIRRRRSIMTPQHRIVSGLRHSVVTPKVTAFAQSGHGTT